tara:strand:- start:189 stop:806 length:618 start_codon:yes stop_codon:yes gene_type:complete
MALGEVGSALIKQYVTNRLLDKGIAGIEKFTDTSSDKDKDTSGFVSQQKTGGLGSIIGRALAFSLLGPILGPLAFAGGKGLLNLGQQRGFLPGGEQQIVDDPRGTFTAEGMQFADVQDTLGSMDSGTDIDYNTGDITDKSTGEVTGNVYDEVAISTPSPAPAYDFDDSGSDSGSDSGGGSPGSSGPGGSDEMGSFRYGGLASLYR